MAKKETRKEKFAPERVLASWRDLMKALPRMNEQELEAALNHETNKPEAEQRADVVMRLRRRIVALATKRAKDEITKELGV